ncbi:hypothetical protein GH808_00680 [Acetobacterium fimetarium]|uniref:Transmembrane protein n=1 Tax=Acetobacterium fimetarium TaxID=52691 RepID=A0ABR6WR22_9FIRM|nr:hypothetical protein [Acetobacterium fimetarium]MBC3802958.1 hypothetical protein [Acetobacterium fimetarium]
MNHQPPDDHRIPDDLLIPLVVTLTDKNETDEETAEDFDDETVEAEKGPGCCGCLIVFAFFYGCGVIFSLLFDISW